MLNVFSYSMTLPSEKGYRSVEFFGGSRKTGQKGMLITEDPELQKALEKHSSFNREYYLESQTIVREETPVVPETVSSEEVVKREAKAVAEKKAQIVCPECGEPLSFEGGCNICKNCGWSKCS